MKPKLILLLVTLALLAAWLGRPPCPGPTVTRPSETAAGPALTGPALACRSGSSVSRLDAYAPCVHCSRRRVCFSSGAADRTRTPETAASRRRADARAALARAGRRRRRRPGHRRATSRATSASRSSSSTPGRVVTLPTARVWVSRALEAPPFLESSAKLERIGVPGGDEADATHIYVAHLRLPEPGTYWLLAEPEGGKDKVQALGNVVVSADDPEPSPGDPAPASETPTLASAGGDLVEAHDAGAARRDPSSLLGRRLDRGEVPFVVTFSTPKFCTSRTCGPVVDVVEEAAQPLRGRGLSASSTSRSTRTTTLRRASTAGCRSGGSRRSRGRSSSGATAGSSSATRARCRWASSRRRCARRARGDRRVGLATASLPQTTSPTRSMTICGTRARGLSLSTVRTSSATSSTWIISSAGIPVQSVIFVATKAGQIAVARTPLSASSRFKDS